MSIGRSQAAALADNFLDDIGSDEGLQPRETLTELFLIAGELVRDAQDNLNASNSIASGKLSASIAANEPVTSGNTVTVDIEMNFYGQFVNSGVKGTKSGSGLYAFKSSYPNPAMVKALLAGISSAKKKTTNVNRKRTVSANETKNVKVSDISKAYGAARNIKMYGIKPTGFMDKAILSARAKVESRLDKALEVDVLNSLSL